MRKSSLLIGVFFCTAIRAEAGVGWQGFHGRAASITDTTDADGYTMMSCAQEEGARCAGQCAEVWCASKRSGDCTLGSRSVVRVADRCATCERGDLFLSRDIFQQLSGTNTYMHLFSVRWRCVNCGSNGQVDDDVMRPGPENQVHATLTLDNKTDQDAHQSIEDGTLRYSLSGPDIAESSDTKVEMLPVDNNDESKGNAVSNNSSSGEVSSGLGATPKDVKRENVQREKIEVPPISTLPSSLSSDSAADASSLPPPVPSTIISSSGSSMFGGESSSGGPGSSLSSSTVNEDPSYSVISTPFDNSQDARAFSASSGLSGTSPDKDQPPTSTTVFPNQMSDDSVDNRLSATLSVTKSPFFYASIVLGIVGSIGATVGYRAKQKRSYRDERKAFRMFAQTGTHVCNPRPTPSSMAALASRTRPGSHSIAIL